MNSFSNTKNLALKFRFGISMKKTTTKRTNSHYTSSEAYILFPLLLLVWFFCFANKQTTPNVHTHKRNRELTLPANWNGKETKKKPRRGLNFSYHKRVMSTVEQRSEGFLRAFEQNKKKHRKDSICSERKSAPRVSLKRLYARDENSEWMQRHHNTTKAWGG